MKSKYNTFSFGYIIGLYLNTFIFIGCTFVMSKYQPKRFTTLDIYAGAEQACKDMLKEEVNQTLCWMHTAYKIIHVKD